MPLLNEKTVQDIQESTGVAAIAPIVGMDCKQKMLANVIGQHTDPELGAGYETKRVSIGHRVPAFGLLMAFISVVCFSISSVIVKVLTDLHSIQILVIRCIFQFMFYFITALLYKHPLCGRSGHRVELALRCLSGTLSVVTLFMAIRLMPLADAATIHFSSPVFVTIFAYFLLKEPLTVLQMITGTITLVGVVIIAKPEFLFGSEGESVHENRLLGTILASVSALAASFTMIFLRKLKSTPVVVVVMWYSATVILSGSIILIVLNKLTLPTGIYIWTFLVLIGLCGIGEQFFLTTAFKYENAGPVSVARTLNIVLSFIWEAALLSETIEWTSVLGASIVTICVLILALVKWRSEAPQLFDKIEDRLFCCVQTVEQNNLKTMPESLRASTESVDSTTAQSTVHSNAILLKSDDEDRA